MPRLTVAFLFYNVRRKHTFLLSQGRPVIYVAGRFVYNVDMYTSLTLGDDMAELDLTQMREDIDTLEESKAETSHTHDMSDISSEALGSFEQKLTEHEQKLLSLEGNISDSKIFFFGRTDKLVYTVTILIPVFAPGKTVVNVSGSAKISFICNNQWIHEDVDPTAFENVLLVNGGTMVYMTYPSAVSHSEGYNLILGYITGLNISFS